MCMKCTYYGSVVALMLYIIYICSGDHTSVCSLMYVAPLNAPPVTKAMTLFSVTKAFSRQTLAGELG